LGSLLGVSLDEWLGSLLGVLLDEWLDVCSDVSLDGQLDLVLVAMYRNACAQPYRYLFCIESHSMLGYQSNLH
jgi:hypothetical protein